MLEQRDLEVVQRVAPLLSYDREAGGYVDNLMAATGRRERALWRAALIMRAKEIDEETENNELR